MSNTEKLCKANFACEFAGLGVLNNANYGNEDDDKINDVGKIINDDEYKGFGDGPILSNLNSCCNLAEPAGWPAR